MTEAELFDALERIQGNELLAGEPREGSFAESPWTGWEEASRRLAEVLENAAEDLRAFIRVTDPAVGIVLTDWTGDVSCVWNGRVNEAAKERHLVQFEKQFQFRIRLGQTLAAALRAALTISRSVEAPLTALSAVHAAWALIRELEMLRAAAQG